MDNAPTMVLTLMIIGMIAGVVAIPMFSAVTMEYVDGEYNDASLASWIRYDYGSDDYDLEITTDGTNITIGNQTGTADDMILYADEKSSVMSIDGGLVIVNGYGDTPSVAAANTVTITKNNGSIVITDGTDTIVSATAPAWAYYPDENGNYAFFNSNVENVRLKAGDNTAFAGSFAGVYAYNDMCVVEDYGKIDSLLLNADIANNVINSVDWAVSVGESTLMVDPAPVDDNDRGALRALPTPQYVDEVTEVWGFDVVSGTDVKIVSYLGTSQPIIEIPSTVKYGGVTYDVVQLGKGNNDDAYCIDSTIQGQIVIPDSVKVLNRGAFSGCAGLTGTVTIPNSVETWERNVFKNCTGLTGVVIEDGVKSIGWQAFYKCTGLTGDLVIPDSVEDIGAQAFYDCAGLTGDLVIPDGITVLRNGTFYGCGFDSVILPKTLTTLDVTVFYGCTNMSGVLVIPDSVTSIGFNCFKSCGFENLVLGKNIETVAATSFADTAIDTILNLSGLEITGVEYGLNASTVKDNIESFGSIAPLIGTVLVSKSGDVYDMIGLIPIIMILGVVLVGVAMVGYRYV